MTSACRAALSSLLLLASCSSTTEPPAVPSALALATTSGPLQYHWQAGEYEVRNDVGWSRRGTTESGFSYSYLDTGTGRIEKAATGGQFAWEISCKVDAMSDARICTALSTRINLVLLWDKAAAPLLVCVLGHDFPGRQAAIRVDTRAPLETDKKGCVGGAIVGELLTATKVTTRHVAWPYDRFVDAAGSPAGLREAVGLVTHIRENIDRISTLAR